MSQEQRTKSKDSKNEDYIRFENFLAGTGNEFIGRGAPRSNTATHMLHLKQLKNPVDFMRYVKGVVFPGKEFMVEKYGLVSSSELRVTSKKKISSSELRVTSKTSEIRTPYSILRTKFWWLWYPYRWWVALRAIFSVKW